MDIAPNDPLLAYLHNFTGPDWEQEDDVTLVTVRYRGPRKKSTQLTDFELPSAAGNERPAMEKVAEAVASLGLPRERLERLKTAVAEATMNAMEHGNRYRADQPVRIQAESDGQQLRVRITDYGGGTEIPAAETPDIDQKLAGLQSPRGWGLFLIKSMVDEMNVTDDGEKHTLELVINLE